MKHNKYHHQLGTTVACTKRMTKTKKEIGQKDIKGATRDCLF